MFSDRLFSSITMKIGVVKIVQLKKPCLWKTKQTNKQNKTPTMENILCQNMQETGAEMVCVTLEQQSIIKVAFQQG